MDRQFYCPQCGEDAPELHEGYCEGCCRERQRELDEHNAAVDLWGRMTTGQRDAAIRNAIRLATK